MRYLLKATMLTAMLLACGSIFAAQISVRIGPPPPPRVERVRPLSPGPDFVWVDGYWYPLNGHYRWHEGYWTRPPYEGARWIRPHHEGDEYYNGYWEGDRGRIAHDHRWDQDRDRDFHHDRDRGDEHRSQ